jgi:hypothetical protein
MKRRAVLAGLVVMAASGALLTAYAAIVGSKEEGLVEYVSAQKEIFVTGKAASVVSLKGEQSRRTHRQYYPR